MLRLALSACGKTHASLASHNNHWGVPLSLANLPPDARYGVFELGMNHAGEIEKLVAMVRPHVAAITVVAPAHMGAFDTIEEIARAKAEIFSGLEPGGTAVVNADDKQAALLVAIASQAGIRKVLTFGRKPGSDFRQTRLRSGGERSSLVVGHGEAKIAVKLDAAGAHMASNALCALAIANSLGADLAKCAEGLAGFSAGAGRGQRHHLKYRKAEFELIDESYNANPASMEAAIGLLGQASPGPRGRRIAVLGDMLELGKHSEQLHRSLVRPLRARQIDRVFLVGPEMAALAEALPKKLHGGHYEEASKVVTPLLASLRGGDVVMIKASNGLKFGALVRSLLDACASAEAAAQ
jgi:UDP-N-acetylmuramoyl-tripeptide--D-alanyl-D-alanine ligase